METNKFLVERKLAGFSVSPYLLIFYHSQRFCSLLTNEMNGTGYMDIDPRKQQFSVWRCVSWKVRKKKDTYVGLAALDNLNDERLLVELSEI